MIKEFGFSKSQRLLNSSQFSPVFDQPCFKIHHPNILILAKKNDLGVARLGIIVAKKNVKLAVKRNRIKRLTRETFRNKQHKLPAIDAIVLARRGCDQLDNASLVEALNGLWNRAAKKATKPGS